MTSTASTIARAKDQLCCTWCCMIRMPVTSTASFSPKSRALIHTFRGATRNAGWLDSHGKTASAIEKLTARRHASKPCVERGRRVCTARSTNSAVAASTT